MHVFPGTNGMVSLAPNNVRMDQNGATSKNITKNLKYIQTVRTSPASQQTY